MHVLSTPPAFILSQDQTLMFKFVLGHSKAWLFYNRFLLCLKSVHIEKTAQLRFRFVSLFGVRQTRLSPPASRQINLTPCIRTPSCFSLLSQNLSRLFHCSVIKVVCCSRLSDNFYILPKSFAFVKNFFELFSKFKTQKEGFEPSRRFPDLYP